MVGKKMKAFLESQGILPLTIPKNVTREAIMGRLEKRGFQLTQEGQKQLKEHLGLIRSEGLGSLMVLGEAWRKRKELKIETVAKGVTQTYFAFYLPVRKRRR